jgi:hypothetical protein
MTYLESAQGEMIDFKRAMLELKNHGFGVLSGDELADFQEFCGLGPSYDAGRVLEWLGY